MSNYTITTDFGAKDSLPSSNSAKVVRGSEFTTEFTNIQTAIATKADTAGDTFTGAVTFDAAVTLNSTATITGDLTVDTDTLFVDVSADKVGIGTTSPDSLLTIDKDVSTAFDSSEDGAQRSNTNTLLLKNEDGTANSFAQIAFDLGASNQPIARIAGINTGTSSSALAFVVEGSNVKREAMRIDSSGNVGVGTTSPNVKLHIDNGATSNLITQVFGGGTIYSGVGVDGTGAILTAGSSGSADASMIFRTASSGSEAERMRIDSSGNVGIGITNPSEKLQVNGNIKIGDSHIIGDDGFDNLTLISSSPEGIVYGSNTDHIFKTGATGLDATGTERMRIDSSGNLLVGTTETDIGYTDSGAGFSVSPLGFAQIARSSDASLLYLNKLDNDGDIILFEKDGLGVGSIGSRGGAALFIESAGSTGKAGLDIDVVIAPRKDGALSDGQIDLGTSAYRFQDLYRSGSTYSTSDRNKKQDIRDLTDAEARVATVAKGSLKAFRYIDSVEAEGDEANIHFGIIAQDLKAAFEAEGLNANDYQVFKTSTYTDDDGVEQTTYSICYENLLAFIIAAI